MRKAKSNLVVEAASLIARRCEEVSVDNELTVAHLAGYVMAIIHLIDDHLTEEEFATFTGVLEDVIRENGGDALMHAMTKYPIPPSTH